MGQEAGKRIASQVRFGYPTCVWTVKMEILAKAYYPVHRYNPLAHAENSS